MAVRPHRWGIPWPGGSDPVDWITNQLGSLLTGIEQGADADKAAAAADATTKATAAQANAVAAAATDATTKVNGLRTDLTIHGMASTYLDPTDANVAFVGWRDPNRANRFPSRFPATFPGISTTGNANLQGRTVLLDTNKQIPSRFMPAAVQTLIAGGGSSSVSVTDLTASLTVGAGLGVASWAPLTGTQIGARAWIGGAVTSTPADLSAGVTLLSGVSWPAGQKQVVPSDGGSCVLATTGTALVLDQILSGVPAWVALGGCWRVS